MLWKQKLQLQRKFRILDDKAQYDAACKRLLSERIILAWIMKACVEEFRDCEIHEIAAKYIVGTPQVGVVPVDPDESNGTVQGEVAGTGVGDATMTEGTVTYDVRFMAAAPVSGELIRLIINVEAQNNFYPGYPLIKRGIYYCSRMISAQCGTEFVNAHYEKIKKVYSIWICMNPPKNRKNTITRYRIAEDNLVGSVKEQKAYYDLMTAVMVCLGAEDDQNYEGLLKLLDVLFSTEVNLKGKQEILEQEFSIGMTQTMESEVSLMCNLSQGIEEKGIQKGKREERQRGIQAMVSVLKDLNVAEDVIVKKLEEKFGLSAGQAKKYIN